MNKPTQSELVRDFTQVLLNMAELFKPIQEAVFGYRTSLEDQGFSNKAAEEMAVQYHQHLIKQLGGG